MAVDERAERVIHVFVGRDLSTGGLRVEAHPALAIGDALRLAIYSASDSDPLIVDAQEVRDDGDHLVWKTEHIENFVPGGKARLEWKLLGDGEISDEEKAAARENRCDTGEVTEEEDESDAIVDELIFGRRHRERGDRRVREGRRGGRCGRRSARWPAPPCGR